MEWVMGVAWGCCALYVVIVVTILKAKSKKECDKEKSLKPKEESKKGDEEK